MRHETIVQLRRALEVQREGARQQAEHWLDAATELEEALDRYVRLFQEAPVGYLTFDRRGTIVELNRAAGRLLNVADPVRAKGKPFLTYVFRPDVKIFLRHLLNCTRHRSAAVLRLGRGKEGLRYVRLITEPASTLHARHRHYLAIIVDIDEERRRDKDLRRSEKRHREIVEAASEGICITNEAGEIVFANGRLGALVGAPSASLIGRQLDELVADADSAGPASTLDGRRSNAKLMEQRLRRRDGAVLHVSASESLLRDNQGRFTGTLRMYTDATARHQLSEAREMLVRQLVAAQEGERQRIARELHDQFGQHIVALSLGLARLGSTVKADKNGAALIEQLRAVTDSLARDMHTLALELRPSALDHLGVAAALRGYGEHLSTRTKLQIDMHFDSVDDLRLPASVQTGIYRIAQEALTNVVKHADARCVSVILEKRAGALQLIVEDDGRGFDHRDDQSAAHKLGLTGMRERAALLGGALTVESSPGRGTTVYARIPINVFQENGNEQKTSTVTGG